MQNRIYTQLRSHDGHFGERVIVLDQIYRRHSRTEKNRNDGLNFKTNLRLINPAGCMFVTQPHSKRGLKLAINCPHRQKYGIIIEIQENAYVQ